MILYFIVLFSLTIFIGKSDLSASGPTVITNNGLIKGLTKQINGASIDYFLGIPYAELPVGRLRFKKPVPKSKLNSTYSATQIKSQCYQTQNTSVMSEDCLYLNIWAPSLGKSCKLPVMLWIHGGFYLYGSGTLLKDGFNIYDGTQLASRDVIIVTINYRLGVFGFLYGGSDEAPGNVALWDQALALKWVKDNIEGFGGDPDNICIFGYSTGAISVSFHIVSPITRTLFKNAIIESGSLYIKLASTERETALNLATSFATKASYLQTNVCNNTNNDWVQCLKNISADKLNAAHNLLLQSIGVVPAAFTPIFGDEFLPKDANKAIIEGDFKRDCNVLMGHNNMEGIFFTLIFERAIGLNGRYDPQIPYIYNNSKAITFNDISLMNFNKTVADTIAKAYTDPFPNISPVDVLTSNELRRSASNAYGDFITTCPTIIFGAKLVMNSKFRGNVYQYRQTYINSQSISYRSVWAKATHEDELPLVFGRPLSETSNNWTQTDRFMSRKMMYIWTQFARNGNPPYTQCENWPKYKYINGNIIATYVELNPFPHLYKIYYDRYKGNDGYFPSVTESCLTFWYKLITEMF